MIVSCKFHGGKIVGQWKKEATGDGRLLIYIMLYYRNVLKISHNH